MKKVINKVVLVLLLIPVLSYSQIRFGAKVSGHRSNISEIHKGSKGRIAGSIGVVAQIPIGYDNQFYFQPEVNYSLQGEKDNQRKMFQNYLTVPLMFRAYFSESDNEFFGELGPQVGFLVSEKNKETDLSRYGTKPKSIDVSVGGGIGYSYLRKYELSLRYNYGLIDVYKDYYKQQRTSILALSFSYMFN